MEIHWKWVERVKLILKQSSVKPPIPKSLEWLLGNLSLPPSTFWFCTLYMPRPFLQTCCHARYLTGQESIMGFSLPGGGKTLMSPN